MIVIGTVQDMSFLVCHVTSRGYMVRETREIKSEFIVSLVTCLQSLVIIDLWEMEICHHPVKFGGNKVCRLGDIKLLKCHVN